jgi:hypothetical protein
MVIFLPVPPRGCGPWKEWSGQSLQVTRGQTAILDFVRAVRDLTGNPPPLPAIFPDHLAPVVREVGAERESAGSPATSGSHGSVTPGILSTGLPVATDGCS